MAGQGAMLSAVLKAPEGSNTSPDDARIHPPPNCRLNCMAFKTSTRPEAQDTQELGRARENLSVLQKSP